MGKKKIRFYVNPMMMTPVPKLQFESKSFIWKIILSKSLEFP